MKLSVQRLEWIFITVNKRVLRTSRFGINDAVEKILRSHI